MIVDFGDLYLAGFDEPTELNGLLLFQGYHYTLYGRELYRSDGTAGGTVIVKDIHPSGHSIPTGLTNVRGTLYFAADDGSGEKLWRSDGTSGGTVVVSPSWGGYLPGDITDQGDLILFVASDETHGRELWKTNGTTPGTAMVKEINPTGDIGVSHDTRYLTNVNGTVFFSASDGVDGYELWKSDGTAGGTILVRNINPSGGSGPRDLTDVDGTLFFTADDGVHGRELWKSNGTLPGTTMVLEINPFGDIGTQLNQLYFTAVQQTLFFAANDGVHGWQLWKSDGTVEGTTMVLHMNPSGSVVSGPAYLTAVDGMLLFSIDDGIHGRELWISDGTAAGTRIFQDINPTGSSYPTEFTLVGERVFFAANDGIHGEELWALSLSEVSGLEQESWVDYP